MSEPRIGFDATAAVTQGGGIGRYTRELLEALLEVNVDYRFRIFAARAEQDIPVNIPLYAGERATFRVLPFSPKWMYRLWYRLRLPLPVQLFSGNLDLFHSPDFVLPPVMGNVPTLLTVHDLSFALFPETFTPSLVNYLNRVVPWSVQRATHILADSESTKRDLVRLYRTPVEKVTVLYSGVGEEFKPIADVEALAAVRKKYQLGERPYLFTVGTLQPRKNLQMLIRAFRPIAAKQTHNLIIAGGKGWLYEELLRESEQQGVENVVRFVGFVDDRDLPALYSGATALLFPSLYEGFGLPILEAMACGTPVIASDASSLPEVVGAAGMLVSPHEQEQWTRAMETLMQDSNLREHFIAAGFAQAAEFSWQNAARELISIYGSMLGK